MNQKYWVKLYYALRLTELKDRSPWLMAYNNASPLNNQELQYLPKQGFSESWAKTMKKNPFC